MPVNPTYPGVNIEEISSGGRTTTGVATSITALVGRALQGSVSTPVIINSFADVEHIFSGLWVESSQGFSVQDLFLDGQAVIVRLMSASGTSNARIDANSLTLDVVSAGPSANLLRVCIDAVDAEVAQSIADNLGAPIADGIEAPIQGSRPTAHTIVCRSTKASTPRARRT